MRLTCPSCAAIYEVEDIAIPASGRRVRCSACDAGWRVAGDGAAVVRSQAKLAAIAARASVAFDQQDAALKEPALAEAAQSAPSARPDTAPVADQSAPPKPQETPPAADAPPAPPLAAEAAPEPGKPASPPVQDTKAPEIAAKAPASPASAQPSERAAGALSNAQSDKGEFRTFKPIRMQPAPVAEDDDEDDEERSSPLRSILGFFVGFALVLILFAPYLFRDQIIDAAPSLAPFVDGYADTIRWVQNGVRSAYEAIAEQVRYLVSSPPPPPPPAPPAQ